MTTTSGSNYTTLYNKNASISRPQQPYGNANVVSLLAAGTDGGNTVTNIIATGNVTADNFIGNLIGNVTGNINGNINATNVTITGNLSGNTGNFSGNVTAPFFIGNVVGNISGNIVVPGVQGSVLFNDGGNAGADTGFIYDKTLNTLGVLDGVTSNVFTGNLSGTTSTVSGNSNAAIFNGNFNGGNVVSTGNVTFSGANVSLGVVGNLHITGGSASQVLTTDGSGGLSWTTITVPSAGIIVQEEGSTVAATANTLNFTGTGVTASAVGNVVTVNVPGATTANIIANVNSNVSIPTANGNIVLNANAGTNEQWIFDTTGNITTPANSVISSVTNNLTLGADTLFSSLRIGGRPDNAALPGAKQTGWYFNVNYNGGLTGIFTNTGSTTDSLDVYFIVPTGSTLGSAVVTIDTLALESLQNGPLTWDNANAALLVGQGISVLDFDVSVSVPQATIFPLGTTIQSVNVGGGTITMSAVALKTSTNFGIDAGTVISSPVDGYYQLVGDTSVAGTIDFWGQPQAMSTDYGLTGYGGAFLANPPAGSTLTYTPAKTWSTYPELRTASTPGTWRAIDQNNVPETVMSYTRYNNPIVIGADSTGNAAGFPTLSGRSDVANSFNGITLLASGLDTRVNGDVVAGFPNGQVPKMALNFVNYEIPNTNANIVLKRQARERQGPLVSSLSGAGNINTAVSVIYAQQFQGLGSVRFNGLGGTQGASSTNPNPLVAQAGMYSRAETDFNVPTSTPTGLYFQYTPSNLGSGNARTFLRAESLATTVSGGNVVYIKPVSNYGTGNAAVIRNQSRELNAVQDTIWLQAAYYSGTGNATAEGTGTLVQARGDRSTGNVAIGINRAVGTTGSYEFNLKAGESALTLYDKNNAANIATFTNTTTTINGNLVVNNGNVTAGNIITNSGNITGNSNIAITGTITGYNKTYGSLNHGTTITGLTANTVYAFPLTVVAANNVTVASTSRITVARAGTYNIQISVQLQNTDLSNDYDFTVWFAKNGTDLTYSATQYTVVNGRNPGAVPGKNVAALNFVDTCAANDYYEIRYAVENTAIEMPFVAGQTVPYVRPEIPPVIVTVVPVGA